MMDATEYRKALETAIVVEKRRHEVRVVVDGVPVRTWYCSETHRRRHGCEQEAEAEARRMRSDALKRFNKRLYKETDHA